MIKIGQKIEDLEFEYYQNLDIKKQRFSDFNGKWLVLLFYPADFTFICPTELEDAARRYEAFKKEGAEIFSISTDTIYVHKAWHDQSAAVSKIRYPMIADPAAKMCRYFGTYSDDIGTSLRGTFIIDPDRILKSLEIHDNSIGRSAEEILRKLQAAVFVHGHEGEVCPANWHPGDKTLKPGLDLVGKI